MAEGGFRTTAKRAALVAASALLSINLWTGAPLLAIWVGSRVAPASGLSMGAVFVVMAVLAIAVIAIVAALARLSAAYDELTGRPVGVRRTSPWLRSMRGEREEVAARRRGSSAVERTVTIAVVLAVLALEAWFFFFAGSSLPSA